MAFRPAEPWITIARRTLAREEEDSAKPEPERRTPDQIRRQAIEEMDAGRLNPHGVPTR